MKHNKKINTLSRKSSYRKSILSNMANSLIENKRIFTTLNKAKALSMYIEPIINKSKKDTTHSRRMVFSRLQNKFNTSKIFGEISKKVDKRPGGYTRIIKTGFRYGDGATKAMIELVDFNENYSMNKINKKHNKTRRSSGVKKMLNK